MIKQAKKHPAYTIAALNLMSRRRLLVTARVLGVQLREAREQNNKELAQNIENLIIYIRDIVKERKNATRTSDNN